MYVLISEKHGKTGPKQVHNIRNNDGGVPRSGGEEYLHFRRVSFTANFFTKIFFAAGDLKNPQKIPAKFWKPDIFFPTRGAKSLAPP